MQTDVLQIVRLLLAERMEKGVRLLENHRDTPGYQPSKEEIETNLDKVVKIWSELFPQRTVTFNDSEVRFTAYHGGATRGVGLGPSLMSDGERQALYLLVKVATTNNGAVLVIDEPETYLHAALSRRLWDILEDLRPDTRFVYITHDVTFALSRRNASFVACRADGSHVALASLNRDVLQEILGAASLSPGIVRVAFCEGTTGSLDLGLLDAWFFRSNTSVWPAGGCDQVQQAVQGFKLIPDTNAQVLGIVDRDVRCDDELAVLKTRGLHVLAVGEIEHVYALPSVVTAVLKRLGVKQAQDVAKRLDAMRERLFKELKACPHRFALSLAQDEIRWRLTFPTKEINVGPNAQQAEANLTTEYQATIQKIDPAQSFARALKIVNDIIASNSLDRFLERIPTKSSIAAAAEATEMKSADAYARLVREGLRGELDSEFEAELRSALKGYLPE